MESQYKGLLIADHSHHRDVLGVSASGSADFGTAETTVSVFTVVKFENHNHVQ